MVDPCVFLTAKKWIAFFGSVLVSTNVCLAQENIRFERISVNEGLSQSDVKSIVQDKLGFLWIGARDGLNRYDGFEFRKYNRQKDDSTSLQFNQILDVQVDSLGSVWIGSVGGISIYNYERDNFQNFFFSEKELQSAEVNHILFEGQDRILLSTNKGLVRFNRKQKRFFVSEEMVALKGMQVSHACQIKENEFWVGTNAGVFAKTTTGSGWTRLLEGNSIQHISVDPNGKIYISSSKGLFRYDFKKGKIEQLALPLGFASVNRVLRMQNGDLWVASNKIIVLDKNDSFKYVLGHDNFNPQSLSEDRARVIFQTRDGVIWVGTFGYGLNKFNPDVARFLHLNAQTLLPLSGNYVSTVFTSDDTTLLVGTSRGLDIIDLGKKSTKHFSNEKDLFQILKIFADRENKIWVTTSSGLMLYDGGQLISVNPLRSVYDLAEWDETNLILAPRAGGIYLFNRKTKKTSLFIRATELPEEVSCVLPEDNHVWIGCKDGLKLYDRNGQLMKHFTSAEPGSLHSFFVKSLFRDSKKNLWVGTWGGGLSVFNTRDSTFATLNVNDGLPNNVVYGILEDQSGVLWLSTNLGLSAFHPKHRTFRNFNFFDGLQSNEFNTGAYFKSPNGKLYFGGVNGLSSFHPATIVEKESDPSILTTSITVNNKTLTFSSDDTLANVLMLDKIKSSWKENDIGLTFTAVDFKHAQTRHFQYAVNDTVWYDIGTRRSLELLDLSGGHHEIKVRTRNSDGNWSRPRVLLAIDIVPAVWERMWFRITALLVFVAMVFAAYRYRVSRLKKLNARLNKLVEERTKEIQTINEEVATQNDQLHALNKELQAFSYSVSHDLRAPLRSVIGYSQMLEEDYGEKLDEQGKKTLAVIQQSAVRMNKLIADLLEFSKLGSKGLQKTKIDSDLLLRSVLDNINNSMRHKAEIKLNSLPFVNADSNLLSQVWINLISNAIKYSAKKETPTIEIGFHTAENEIVFYVKDNGAGFDMKYADKLFGVFQRLHKIEEFEGTGVGLALVQRIINQHGGRVWAQGKINEGATFYFSLPS